MIPINRKELECQYANSYHIYGNFVQLYVVLEDSALLFLSF